MWENYPIFVPIFRPKNRGWRIDSFIINKEIVDCVVDTGIIQDAGLETKPQGSDHGAIFLTLDIDCISKRWNGDNSVILL